MNCITKDSKGAESVMDYCAGTVDPAEAAAIEEHLRECAGCREMVEAQRDLWQTLDAWKPIEVSPDFDARLYARISQEQAAPWWRRMWQLPAPLFFSKPASSVAAVAAVAAVLTLIVVVGMPGTNTVPPAKAPVQKHQVTERIDIQEVQQALDDLDLLSPSASPL